MFVGHYREPTAGVKIRYNRCCTVARVLNHVMSALLQSMLPAGIVVPAVTQPVFMAWLLTPSGSWTEQAL